MPTNQPGDCFGSETTTFRCGPGRRSSLSLLAAATYGIIVHVPTGERMAETPRIYPERPLIKMFLSGYEQGAWKDAVLNWIEETEENAVEVIATRADGKTLAIEHTLIELFKG